METSKHTNEATGPDDHHHDEHDDAKEPEEEEDVRLLSDVLTHIHDLKYAVFTTAHGNVKILVYAVPSNVHIPASVGSIDSVVSNSNALEEEEEEIRRAVSKANQLAAAIGSDKNHAIEEGSDSDGDDTERSDAIAARRKATAPKHQRQEEKDTYLDIDVGPAVAKAGVALVKVEQAIPLVMRIVSDCIDAHSKAHSADPDINWLLSVRPLARWLRHFKWGRVDTDVAEMWECILGDIGRYADLQHSPLPSIFPEEVRWLNGVHWIAEKHWSSTLATVRVHCDEIAATIQLLFFPDDTSQQLPISTEAMTDDAARMRRHQLSLHKLPACTVNCIRETFLSRLETMKRSRLVDCVRWLSTHHEMRRRTQYGNDEWVEKAGADLLNWWVNKPIDSSSSSTTIDDTELVTASATAPMYDLRNITRWIRSGGTGDVGDQRLDTMFRFLQPDQFKSYGLVLPPTSKDAINEDDASSKKSKTATATTTATATEASTDKKKSKSRKKAKKLKKKKKKKAKALRRIDNEDSDAENTGSSGSESESSSSSSSSSDSSSEDEDMEGDEDNNDDEDEEDEEGDLDLGGFVVGGGGSSSSTKKEQKLNKSSLRLIDDAAAGDSDEEDEDDDEDGEGTTPSNSFMVKVRYTAAPPVKPHAYLERTEWAGPSRLPRCNEELQNESDVVEVVEHSRRTSLLSEFIRHMQKPLYIHRFSPDLDGPCLMSQLIWEAMATSGALSPAQEMGSVALYVVPTTVFRDAIDHAHQLNGGEPWNSVIQRQFPGMTPLSLVATMSATPAMSKHARWQCRVVIAGLKYVWMKDPPCYAKNGVISPEMRNTIKRTCPLIGSAPAGSHALVTLMEVSRYIDDSDGKSGVPQRASSKHQKDIQKYYRPAASALITYLCTSVPNGTLVWVLRKRTRTRCAFARANLIDNLEDAWWMAHHFGPIPGIARKSYGHDEWWCAVAVAGRVCSLAQWSAADPAAKYAALQGTVLAALEAPDIHALDKATTMWEEPVAKEQLPAKKTSGKEEKKADDHDDMDAAAVEEENKEDSDGHNAGPVWDDEVDEIRQLSVECIDDSPLLDDKSGWTENCLVAEPAGEYNNADRRIHTIYVAVFHGGSFAMEQVMAGFLEVHIDKETVRSDSFESTQRLLLNNYFKKNSHVKADSKEGQSVLGATPVHCMMPNTPAHHLPIGCVASVVTLGSVVWKTSSISGDPLLSCAERSRAFVLMMRCAIRNASHWVREERPSNTEGALLVCWPRPVVNMSSPGPPVPYDPSAAAAIDDGDGDDVDKNTDGVSKVSAMEVDLDDEDEQERANAKKTVKKRMPSVSRQAADWAKSLLIFPETAEAMHAFRMRIATYACHWLPEQLLWAYPPDAAWCVAYASRGIIRSSIKQFTPIEQSGWTVLKAVEDAVPLEQSPYETDETTVRSIPLPASNTDIFARQMELQYAPDRQQNDNQWYHLEVVNPYRKKAMASTASSSSSSVPSKRSTSRKLQPALIDLENGGGFDEDDDEEDEDFDPSMPESAANSSSSGKGSDGDDEGEDDEKELDDDDEADDDAETEAQAQLIDRDMAIEDAGMMRIVSQVEETARKHKEKIEKNRRNGLDVDDYAGTDDEEDLVADRAMAPDRIAEQHMNHLNMGAVWEQLRAWKHSIDVRSRHMRSDDLTAGSRSTTAGFLQLRQDKELRKKKNKKQTGGGGGGGGENEEDEDGNPKPFFGEHTHGYGTTKSTDSLANMFAFFNRHFQSIAKSLFDAEAMITSIGTVANYSKNDAREMGVYMDSVADACMSIFDSWYCFVRDEYGRSGDEDTTKTMLVMQAYYGAILIMAQGLVSFRGSPSVTNAIAYKGRRINLSTPVELKKYLDQAMDSGKLSQEVHSSGQYIDELFYNTAGPDDPELLAKLVEAFKGKTWSSNLRSVMEWIMNRTWPGVAGFMTSLAITAMTCWFSIARYRIIANEESLQWDWARTTASAVAMRSIWAAHIEAARMQSRQLAQSKQPWACAFYESLLPEGPLLLLQTEDNDEDEDEKKETSHRRRSNGNGLSVKSSGTKRARSVESVPVRKSKSSMVDMNEDDVVVLDASEDEEEEEEEPIAKRQKLHRLKRIADSDDDDDESSSSSSSGGRSEVKRPSSPPVVLMDIEEQDDKKSPPTVPVDDIIALFTSSQVEDDADEYMDL
jgi:uncharacterized membrane protein YgcG